MNHNPAPWGDSLQNLVAAPERALELKESSGSDESVTLTQRQLCDLELLMSGALSPLRGFMNQATYDSVLDDLRLPEGLAWPMPITLDVNAQLAEKLQAGMTLALRDPEGFMLAVLKVSDVWVADKAREAEAVYGTTSVMHPGVRYLMEDTGSHYVGGEVEGVQLPAHYEFENLWDTPAELRALFEKMGWRRVLAFHTTKPMHRMQRQLTVAAAKEAQAHILLHPAVGMTKPGDLHYYARVHCYQAARRHFPRNLALLSLLPLAMRMAGPREALWHAIIQQNYGCSHMLVGPEYASPPSNGSGGEEFYGKYAAQELLAQYSDQLGIEPINVEEHQYSPLAQKYLPVSEIESRGEQGLDISERDMRQRLLSNEDFPDWFSYPDVVQEMRRACPPRSRQGFTLFFTGLSGSGKSTLAKIIYAKLIEIGSRPVTLLDGDVVRLNLSSELGFSKEHRNLNVRRIGFVANEITKNNGIAICAPIAPYTAMRRAVRSSIEDSGAFIEIHVATPLEVCEARDRKGLYAKARKGIIPEFTGISDPYEEPEQPEIRIDTSDLNPMEAAQEIFLYLFREGYLDIAETTEEEI